MASLRMVGETRGEWSFSVFLRCTCIHTVGGAHCLVNTATQFHHLCDEKMDTCLPCFRAVLPLPDVLTVPQNALWTVLATYYVRHKCVHLDAASSYRGYAPTFLASQPNMLMLCYPKHFSIQSAGLYHL